MGNVLNVTDASFEQEVKKAPTPVLVDFWAPWCAPCRAFAPTFAAAAEKHPDVLFAKVDTEAQQAIGAHFNIRSIPTLMVFRNNIIVFAEAGALPASALDQVLNAARKLSREADDLRAEVTRFILGVRAA